MEEEKGKIIAGLWNIQAEEPKLDFTPVDFVSKWLAKTKKKKNEVLELLQIAYDFCEQPIFPLNCLR